MKPLFYALALALLTLSQTSSAQTFTVHRTADDSIAFTGSLSDSALTDLSGFSVRFADFTALEEPGEYYLAVPEVGKSVSFRIGADVYDGEIATLMLGFYGWRSGIPIDFTHHGVHYQHAAGHLTDALLDYVDGQVGVSKDGAGGWYDAGDYGKYIPTAAESVNTMLAAWELFSEKLRHVTLSHLPEHGPLPDYLAEIKWELDWMLKMAYNDGSGRVHHKINSPTFPGFVVPAADDPATRYFSTFSTGATAEFVASMAKAVRAFAPYDDVTLGYSQTLLAAAKLSYAYLQANPATVQYDDKVLAAGSYQKKDTDDRLWAAAEYWETTGEAAALVDLETRIGQNSSFVPNFDWDTTTNFGLLTYALSKRAERNPDLAAKVVSALKQVADKLVALHGDSGYGRDYNQYYWGSNGVIARTCMLLQSANVLTPDPKYLDVCADQIGFLYGRNQYNRSQVTGAGIAPPLFPHHRPSGSDSIADPYPGLVVGGGQNATGWKDVEDNYQTNEVAINWNAALVFALAGFIQGEGATPSLGIGPKAAVDCGVRLNSIGYVPGRTKVATIQTDCEIPSVFKCTLGPTTMSGNTAGPLSMIDDMEDGDLSILSRDGRQGSWLAFDDGSGTRTDLKTQPVDRPGSKNALCISGQDFNTWGGGIRVWLNGIDTRELYDASRYTGITFWARGLPTDFRINLVDDYSDPAGQKCASCYDHFHFTFTPNADWKQYTFKWSDAAQSGSGDPQPHVCPSAMYAMQFTWSANTAFDICIDDLAFTTSASSDVPVDGGADAAGGKGKSSGCGCRVGQGEPGNATWIAFAVCAALGIAFRRRRLHCGRQSRKGYPFI
jgi:endoglucanase